MSKTYKDIRKYDTPKNKSKKFHKNKQRKKEKQTFKKFREFVDEDYAHQFDDLEKN